MLHFYKSPKGDFVNFRQMISFTTSHEIAWVVDESGQRYKIGNPDDIPHFIMFLNAAIEYEKDIVTHEEFQLYLEGVKAHVPPDAPATHEKLDHPPGVGIPEGSVPPPAPPPPKSRVEEFDKAEDRDSRGEEERVPTPKEYAEEEGDLLYPPNEVIPPTISPEEAAALPTEVDKPKSKKGGKKSK